MKRDPITGLNQIRPLDDYYIDLLLTAVRAYRHKTEKQIKGLEKRYATRADTKPSRKRIFMLTQLETELKTKE